MSRADLENLNKFLDNLKKKYLEPMNEELQRLYSLYGLTTESLNLSSQALSVAIETKENVGRRVEKTETPSRLYGTDDNGNQVTYSMDSVGTKVLVDGQKVNEFNADEKFDKTGGVIAGNVMIQGNLSISGGNTITSTETLKIKDNIIVANSTGVELIEKAGFVIRVGEDDAYGIMYDPIDDGVKIGLGGFDLNWRFVYKPGEAQLLATRADTITDGHIPKWDNEKKQFVDSGVGYDECVKFTNIAAKNKLGVITSDGVFAYDVTSDGALMGKTLSLSEYERTTIAAFICKGTLENIKYYYVKDGLVDSTETWTDEDKAKACETIGAIGKTDIAGGKGLGINTTGKLTTIQATADNIFARKGDCLLVPAFLENIMYYGITGYKKVWRNNTWVESINNQIPLSDSEKASALNWLGAISATDYASETVGGTVKASADKGFGCDSEGFLTLVAPDNSEIDFQYDVPKALQPKNISRIVKSGLINNEETLNEHDQFLACDWLGAELRRPLHIVYFKDLYCVEDADYEWNDIRLYYRNAYLDETTDIAEIAYQLFQEQYWDTNSMAAAFNRSSNNHSPNNMEILGMFSPDGEKLIIMCNDGTLHKVSTSAPIFHIISNK